MIIDVPTSSVALAVAGVAKQKNKLFVDSGAATSDLTASACAPSVIHYTYDTYMLAKSTGGATVKSGGDTWYFITADYAFGKQLQADTTSFITAAGGKVLGSSALSVPGHHRFLLVPGAGAGHRRQGARLLQRRRRHGEQHQAGGRVRHQRQDAARRHADVHQRRARAGAGRRRKGLRLTETFYWDLNDRTRALHQARSCRARRTTGRT